MENVNSLCTRLDTRADLVQGAQLFFLRRMQLERLAPKVYCGSPNKL